jgi:hypothetical protein
MTTPLGNIAPRLQKLLLMLSSPRDGEVISAVRAIGRPLQNAGHDWHDLSRALTVSKPQARDESAGDMGWRDMRAFCEQHGGGLSKREKEFVANLKHWHRELTERQLAWLTAIHERLQRKAA